MTYSNFRKRVKLLSYVTDIFDIIVIRDLYKLNSDDESL